MQDAVLLEYSSLIHFRHVFQIISTIKHLTNNLKHMF